MKSLEKIFIRNFGRYYWENEFDKETGDNFYYLSFFIKSMGKYKLYEEEHTQHVFTGTDIRECAAKAGFTVKDALSEDIKSPIDFSRDRVYYVLQYN